MRKILVLSLVLALALTLVLPSVAMAGNYNKLTAEGYLSSIDTGTVSPIDGTDQWLVSDRHIYGEFQSVSKNKYSDLVGPFTLTYGGVFALPSQSGNLHGQLECGQNLFVVDGTSDGAQPTGNTIDLGGGMLAPVYQLSVTGSWVGGTKNKTSGSFTASLAFIPTPEGHVYMVLPDYSSFTMTSK